MAKTPLGKNHVVWPVLVTAFCQTPEELRVGGPSVVVPCVGKHAHLLQHTPACCSSVAGEHTLVRRSSDDAGEPTPVGCSSAHGEHTPLYRSSADAV